MAFNVLHTSVGSVYLLTSVQEADLIFTDLELMLCEFRCTFWALGWSCARQ